MSGVPSVMKSITSRAEWRLTSCPLTGEYVRPMRAKISRNEPTVVEDIAIGGIGRCGGCGDIAVDETLDGTVLKPRC